MGDFEIKWDNRRQPLKMGVSHSKWEGWNICQKHLKPSATTHPKLVDIDIEKNKREKRKMFLQVPDIKENSANDLYYKVF